MVIAKTPRLTKEQKEKEKEKGKDPRQAQLEAKLVNPVSLTLFFLVLAVSIVIGVVLGTTTEVQEWVVAAVIIGGSLIGLYLMFALKIADQWEKAIVLRFGRFRGLQGPGLFWIVPVVDRISAWIDHRVMVTPFTAERTLTKDTVPVDVDAVLFWLVWDAEKAALEVEDYRVAISWAAQTALREIIGKMDLADILVGREKMDAELQRIIDERTTPWGITVQSVEIRDIVIPEALEDAMSRQAQAERERQARVILGESEKQIAESFRQASLAYVDNPTALHLRAMNMLFEGLQERGALIVVPSSAVDTMNLGGMAGLTALAQNAQSMIPKADSDSPNPEDEE
jgi:regulator of protease activity HflC (stomatin/prohibitin superfamily)